MCRELYQEYELWNLEAKSIYDIKNLTVPASVQSFTQYMEFKLENKIANESNEMKDLKRRLLKRKLKAETAESGCPTMDSCNLNEYGSYMVPLDPNYECPGGFSNLINYIADRIPKEKIKLEHAVKKVRRCFDSKEHALLVECYNGTCFRTKHVIVTCSVNYLQKNYKLMFEPLMLDEKKIEAINRVKMGTVDKIFLFYGKKLIFSNIYK